MFRKIIYDNWFANLIYFIKQIYKNKQFLKEKNVKFSWFRFCLYSVLPLDKIQPEILQNPESRGAIINTQTIKLAESIRPIRLNEYLYPEIEELDLYNVLVKFKPNFPILPGFLKTIFIFSLIYFLLSQTIIFDVTWEYLVSLYEMIEK